MLRTRNGLVAVAVGIIVGATALLTVDPRSGAAEPTVASAPDPSHGAADTSGQSTTSTLGWPGWEVLSSAKVRQAKTTISSPAFRAAGWLHVTPDDAGAPGTEINALLENGACPRVAYGENMRRCFGYVPFITGKTTPEFACPGGTGPTSPPTPPGPGRPDRGQRRRSARPICGSTAPRSPPTATSPATTPARPSTSPAAPTRPPTRWRSRSPQQPRHHAHPRRRRLEPDTRRTTTPGSSSRCSWTSPERLRLSTATRTSTQNNGAEPEQFGADREDRRDQHHRRRAERHGTAQIVGTRPAAASRSPSAST